MAPKDKEEDVLKHILQKTKVDVAAMTPGAVLIFMPVI